MDTCRQHDWIDQRVFDLYDEYCHGRIDRRAFLKQAALVAGGLAMAQALMPRYANAQTISFTDERIKAQYVTYPSPGGNSGTMRGYLVQPKGNGPFPSVLVVHENRGLNPYIEDVARRARSRASWRWRRTACSRPAAIPATTMTAATLQAKLDQAKLRTDMLNSAQVPEGARALVRQARRHRLLLGRRHDQLPRRDDGRRPAGRRAVLRRGAGDDGGAEDQGAAADPATPRTTSASTRCGRTSRRR